MSAPMVLGDTLPLFPELGAVAEPTVLPADDGAAEGVKLRDQALVGLQAHRARTVAACRTAMVALYRDRAGVSPASASVSGDDACEWLDRAGCGQDYRLVGAVFRPRSGWKAAGYANSRLKRRHARPVRLWTWVGGQP